MNLMEAKYKTRKIFNEETDYYYADDEYEDSYRKRNDFLRRIKEEIEVDDWESYRPYLADYLNAYLKYLSEKAIENFQDNEYYYPENEIFYDDWYKFTHKDGKQFTHEEIMKKLVLTSWSYHYSYRNKILYFQFILTHLNYYTLEEVIYAVKLAYSIFKFRPEVVNRIIKKNNKIHTYLKDYKYLNTYDDYIKRLINLIISSKELKDKEQLLKRLSYYSKLPKERKAIDVLKDIKEVEEIELEEPEELEENIEEERIVNQEDLDYLKKHPKTPIIFRVEFDEYNPDDLKYLEELLRKELTNKNPKKRLSEKVINKMIEEYKRELFRYKTNYILIKRR